MIEKKVFLGMNQDDSAKDLKAGEYRSAENLVAVADGAGGGVRLENMLGMKSTGISGEGSICIGAWNYKEGNKIYAFYVTSEGLSEIREYDGVRDLSIRLISNAFLGFSVGNPVYDVRIVENLLYFNDGVHGLRKINIEFPKTIGLDSATDERLFSVIKPPPLHTITLNRKTDSNLTDLRPEIREIPLQFATRYVYNDNEVSVFSPFSVIAPALDYDYDGAIYNYIEVKLTIDYFAIQIVKRVELLMREGNDGNWVIYNDFTPDTFTIDNGNDTKSQYYNVYFDRFGQVVPEQEFGSSSESVPRLSDAMEYIEDRLFVVSSLEEYDVAQDDWSVVLNTVLNGSPEDDINNIVYQPSYLKENSLYTGGIIFFDEFGRKVAPVPTSLKSIKIPDTFSTSTVFNLVRYNHPSAYGVTATAEGKPPIWAKKYQFARTENETFSSWFKMMFIAKPLYSTVYKTEEPPAAISDGVYLENGYWYWDVSHRLDLILQGGSGETAEFPEFDTVDLVLPRDIPIPLDEKSILRLAFSYVNKNNMPIKKTYQIDQIENGMIRISGLSWLHWRYVFFNEAGAIRGETFDYDSGFTGDDTVLRNDEIELHFEILNKRKTSKSPLMFETGEVFDVINAGEDSRAFQVGAKTIEGDCYYASYSNDKNQDLNEVSIRTDREFKSISYASLSPVVEPSKVGSSFETDEDGNLVKVDSKDVEYWKVAADSKGRVTVAVRDQRELERGSQIRYSRTFIQDSLINGLSNFPEENKYPISFDRGNVIKLVALSDKLLVAVHARAITSLYINTRFLTMGEGQQFLGQSDNVVGEDRKSLHDYGTLFPESIAVNNNNIYGFDSIMSEPWRKGQDGLVPLGTLYGMKTYFEAKGQSIRDIQRIDSAAVITVIGGFDPWLSMYVLTFSEITYINGSGQTVVVPAETIGFSERVKKWVSFYSFKPEYYSTIMNNLVSFVNANLYRHMETDNRNFFYDATYESKITIVFNERNDLPKIHQNIGISSNEKWSMTCITPEGKESLLDVSNFTLRDSVFYADILRDKNTASDTLKPNQTPLLNGEKMIGETIEVTLTNESSNQVVLDAVYMGYSPMVGHLLSVE